VQELNSSASPTANLLGGLGADELFTRADSTGTKAQLTDALGSTLALTDPQGATATSYTYDPYGNTTTGGATSSNAFQYTGREADNIGSLDYYRARYYSPTLQRFISQDPAGLAGGINRYAYTANDPIDATDPSGNASLPSASDFAHGLEQIGEAALSGVKTFLTSPAGTVVGTLAVCGLAPEVCIEVVELEADTIPAELGAEALPLATEEAAATSMELTTYYPPNGGFLGQAERTFLQPGERIDRFGGSDYSRFFSPEGTPASERALPPGTAGQPLRTFEVAKPFEVQSGTVAPAFSELGGGVQFRTPVPLRVLLARGIVREVP
jgi:RHS repeat-associated protein